MDFFKKIMDWLDDRKNFIVILNILLILSSCYLLYETSSLWQNLLNLFILVSKPFFIAFVIAYVLSPFVASIERRGIPRSFAIAIVIIFLLSLIIIFIGSLVPMLYSKVSELIGPLSNGMMEIQKILLEHFQLDITGLVNEATTAMQNWILDFSFMDTTLGIITNAISKIGSYIINLILAVYFLADYKHIRHSIASFAYKLSPKFAYFLKEIDLQLLAYIKAFLLLMLIQTGIYGCIYLLIGHSNWILLGLLTGASCIFPYIGPMSVNALGIITAFELEPIRIVLLIIAIFVQSNIDSYIITPKVYSSKIQIEPIYVIFSLLTASSLLGPWGIIIAMPMMVIIKISFKTINELKKAD